MTDSPPPEVVKAVRRTVDYKSGDPQLPGARVRSLRLSLSDHGVLPRDAVNDAIQYLLDEDELLLWRDRKGDLRLTRQTEDDLQALLGYMNTELDPPADELERVADCISEVKDE
jgi:hypothetical protein